MNYHWLSTTSGLVLLGRKSSSSSGPERAGSLDPTMADPQQVRAAMLANERARPMRVFGYLDGFPGTVLKIFKDQRGFFGGGGSPPAPAPPAPPPPPDNTAAQAAAARARQALQRKRGRQQTILAGASAPASGLTTNPGSNTLG